MGTLHITWKKSFIGYNQAQRATIRSLGFRRLNQTVTHPDTPMVRGMVNKVIHLVKIAKVEK
jgi:large subunit ribosomal protein L30